LAEKGGTARAIPVRLELQRAVLAYMAAGLEGAAKDTPLFQTSSGWTRKLSGRALSTEQIWDVFKRWARAAGLPEGLRPHSFRVKTATELRRQGVPLEDVQHLLGHAEPRTTALYDRGKKAVTRNIVERIEI
jgi:site-specific recombinase XerD